jgi:hypothetical protein
MRPSKSPVPLDIEADLAIHSGKDMISIQSRGRGILLDSTSLAVFRQLPRHNRSLKNLRQFARGLCLADQAVTIASHGKPILAIDPAQSGRWLGWLLRVPGLKFYFFNWLRHRD